MADFDERKILDFYHIPNLYPSEWPAEKDEEDESENETEKKKPDRKAGRSLTLESTTSERRYIMKTDAKKRGANNLVLKDEPDPLGTTESVVRAMRLVGLNMQDDARLRNRFMLSSTTFSPALFLSQMHAHADTNVLLEGLDVLSKSIDQKSASLKVLVESNFERFVKAKATIDNVYKEMKHRGEETSPPKVHAHTHSHGRRASRSSFRGSSGKNSLPNPLGIHTDSRKKNALVKESEYGVLGIKGPLLDVSAKAEDVWGPALGGREKEENLRAFSLYLTQFKEYVELSPMVSDSIKRKDYETLVDAYNRARRIADAARELSNQLGTQTPDDAQLYQMLLAGRMWYDVESQLQRFKRQLWRRLVSLHTTAKPDYSTGRGQEQHMEILSLLLELGVDNNPVWVWLLSRYDHLKGKIAATADHGKVEIEVLRRRLAGSEKPSPQVVASHLRHLVRQSLDGKTTANDSADVIELWEKTLTFLNTLISPQGILGEVLEFWQTAQSFIDGDAQKSLPLGYNGESQQYHQLPVQAVADLEKGVVELVELIRGHLYDFFAGLPPEDLSLIFSPVPMTPHSPATPGPGFLTPNSLRDPRLAFEPGNPLPPPSPQNGEHWEKLAFWPPWSNSISGVHYLSKMLALVGSAASDLATIGPVRSDEGQVVEQLKSLVGISRERCVTALCAAWNRDAENIKYVEDWQPSAEPGNVTRMPASFAAFEGALLTGIQKILYVSEVMAKPGAGDIVLPPPAKLLQMVRNQYITTLYKALSGMVENAERSVRGSGDDWSIRQETLPIQASSDSVLTKSTLDAGNRNVRMLLTLSNLQALRSQVVPGLNSKFENAFSVKLTDESKTIRDVLGQIDARLFQSYTKQSIEKLETLIQAGIGAPDWSPEGSDRPSAAKPYVYEVLLSLVVVHSEVSTTASSLTTQVLSFLFEQTSTQLLEAFRRRPRYSLWALVQATLDVEFIAQTLNQYVTETASELQSQIYQELDSRTEGDARGRLQGELPGMRDVLKKLRDASKNQFACFKKVRRPTQALGRTDSAQQA